MHTYVRFKKKPQPRSHRETGIVCVHVCVTLWLRSPFNTEDVTLNNRQRVKKKQTINAPSPSIWIGPGASDQSEQRFVPRTKKRTIRFTHLLLQKLTLAPCRYFLHTMPPTLAIRQKAVVEISLQFRYQTHGSLLISCFVQSVRFAHSRRQGQERQRF